MLTHPNIFELFTPYLSGLPPLRSFRDVLVFCVLGQPHASLIAVTPMEGFRKLIFATYRNTRKYSNLAHNGNVAVLVESININRSCLQESIVLTAFGHVEEIKAGEEDVPISRKGYLSRK